MKIHGLQKMTLLDFPGHVACTVFLGGCDFRCPFCHNYELADGTAKPVMEESELLEFLEKRRGLLDGVAFTGGEPCLHTGLPELFQKIRDMGYALKLDTNGCHPDLLQSILDQKLVDYVAMDIKNSPEKYAQTSGVDHVDMEKIRESIRLIMDRSPDYEFRTTVVEELHDEDDFSKMGELIRGAGKYYLQGFTDRDTVPFEGFHAPSPEKMQTYVKIMSRYVSTAALRGMD